MRFNNSKYTKWYFEIINNRKVYKLQSSYEVHHIIPKSLRGSNTKFNLVRLSYREHFICHLLLTKMCVSTQDTHKMCWALHRLTFGKEKSNLIYNSYQYELTRKIHIRNMTNNPLHYMKSEKGKNEASIRVTKDWENNIERRKSTSLRLKKLRNKEKNENPLKFMNSILQASKLGCKAYQEKNANKIEYKGKYYYSWLQLERDKGFNKKLYYEYYLNGDDPEKYLGRLGPKSQKIWINNGNKEIHWLEKYQLPIGFIEGRIKGRKHNTKGKEESVQ